MNISSLLTEFDCSSNSSFWDPVLHADDRNTHLFHTTPQQQSIYYDLEGLELMEVKESGAAKLIETEGQTTFSPIIVDSESEGEDDSDGVKGSLISPISLDSYFSSREPSIFDTPPQSAASTTSTDFLIPEAPKEIIDLTKDETQSKGKQRAVETEVIDVDAIPSSDTHYFDDDIQMLEQSPSDPLNISDFKDLEISDMSNSPDIQQYLQFMMSTLEANRLIQAATWKPVEQTSAISKLPAELMLMIFGYALPSFLKSTIDDPTYLSDRLREGVPVMKVCRQWRYMLLPKILRSVTVSECTFLTKSAHCQFCQVNRHLVSVPVVRSLFDGTATVEMMQMAEHIRTVALSPLPCERRSKSGEDSLESGFVYFLPRVETAILPSNLVRGFLNGSSAHDLNLKPKQLSNIRIYNPTPSAPTRRRLGFSDLLDVGELSSSWVVPEDVKKLELDGDCLRMCAKIPMQLLEELTIDKRTNGDKFVQAPPASALCQFLSIYSTDFSTLSKITLRWLPKPDPSFPLSAGANAAQDPCLCSLLGSIASLEHLDLSTVCPLLFAKKVGKCITSIAFEYPCILNRSRPPPPTKFPNLRALIGPANEMRSRLLPENSEPSRSPTVITLISTKARDMPHLIESSLTTTPSYSLDLGKKLVRVTEYSAKAATRYRLYVNNLVQRSTAAIIAREPKRLLSEYALAARAKSLTDTWQCSSTGPPASRKQRTTVLRWDYDVDLDVFFTGASIGEFMVLGRQKDRLLNAREAEERKVKRLERLEKERIKSAAPPKKRTRKRKADIAEVDLQQSHTVANKKQKQTQDADKAVPISASASNPVGTTIHPGMVQLLWA